MLSIDYSVFLLSRVFTGWGGGLPFKLELLGSFEYASLSVPGGRVLVALWGPFQAVSSLVTSWEHPSAALGP